MARGLNPNGVPSTTSVIIHPDTDEEKQKEPSQKRMERKMQSSTSDASCASHSHHTQNDSLEKVSRRSRPSGHSREPKSGDSLSPRNTSSDRGGAASDDDSDFEPERRRQGWPHEDMLDRLALSEENKTRIESCSSLSVVSALLLVLCFTALIEDGPRLLAMDNIDAGGSMGYVFLICTGISLGFLTITVVETTTEHFLGARMSAFPGVGRAFLNARTTKYPRAIAIFCFFFTVPAAFLAAVAYACLVLDESEVIASSDLTEPLIVAGSVAFGILLLVVTGGLWQSARSEGYSPCVGLPMRTLSEGFSSCCSCHSSAARDEPAPTRAAMHAFPPSAQHLADITTCLTAFYARHNPSKTPSDVHNIIQDYIARPGNGGLRGLNNALQIKYGARMHPRTRGYSAGV